MSHRGSFVTQFIYCPKCLAACKEVLLSNERYLCSTVISKPSGCDDNIIAGRVGSLHPGGELDRFEFKLRFELDDRLCHSVRVAVLADNGQSKVFVCGPEKKKEVNHG